MKADEYTYNSFGDVVSSKVQTDENTYLSTEYVYESNLPYSQKIVQKNIFDADGMCSDIITQFEYDNLGNITCITYPNGNTKKYSYDKIGRNISETLEDGSIRKTEYIDKDNILITTDANDKKLIYKYDSAGVLSKVSDGHSDAVYTEREYDLKKRLVKEKDVNGAIATRSYDSKDRLTSYSVTDKEGKLYSNTELMYNDGENSVTVISGDMHKSIKNVYTYNIFNQLLQKSLITDQCTYTTSYSYDYAGNNIAITDESGNITHFEYDIFGNQTKVTYPEGNSQEYEYDFSKNIVRHINGEGEVLEFIYDPLGRKISEKKHFDGTTSEYVSYYDLVGNVIKSVDECGRETEFEYNERNFLVSSKAFSSAVDGMKTEYVYDAEGNIIKASYGSISDPSRRNITQNIYDKNGNLIKTIDNSGKMSYYKYDNGGNVIKSTDPKGIVTKYEYDVLGRKIKVSNGIDPDTFYSYNILGDIESINNGDKSITYTYNGRGLLSHSFKGNTKDSYIYDERGNVTEHNISDSTAGEIKHTYSYDKNNRLKNVLTPLGTQTLSYDKENRPVKSENSHTGSIREIIYDGRGLPVSTTTKLNNNIVFWENNVYDLSGNKVRSDENGVIKNYTYDGLQRLVSVSENGKDTFYEFDGFGNILKEHQISGSNLNTVTYHYDKDNRLILTENGGNVTSYEYDPNGNMTREYSAYKDTHYEYDGYNRLKALINDDKIVRYEYDAEGLRDRKYTDAGVTEFIYANGNVTAEILPDGSIYTYYRADSIIGSSDSFGNKLYYSQNTHGDVTSIYDLEGNILKDYRYNAYGKTEYITIDGINKPHLIEWYAETNSIHNPFRYCGEYQDLESGFVYLRNRYYEPSIGRFITEDPARDGLNWYVYCRNNPIRYIDPTGYITEEEQKMYKSGKMAPMAYSHLMNLTYQWYLADDEVSKAKYHQWAEDFRVNDYKTTNGAFPNVDAGIEYMPSRPTQYPTEEEHFFRNELNIEFSWNDFKTLNERLPNNLKWKELKEITKSGFHKVGQPKNRKYVSACEHFEVVYTKENYLVNEKFSAINMGTYNYYGPSQSEQHTLIDVLPYGALGNTPKGWIWSGLFD